MKNLLVLLLLSTSLLFSQNHIGHIKVKMSSTDLSYYTDFYFNVNATRALDSGYDARIFESTPLPFSIYSYLVDDTGYPNLPLAVQSLGAEDINDVIIPLGVNAFEGQLVKFEIVESDLTSATKVYIIDALLSNQSDLPYSFIPSEYIKGIGRFYLKFEGDVIFTPDPPPVVKEQMNVSVDYRRGDVIIKGSIPVGTSFKFYHDNVLIKEKNLSTKKRQAISIGGLMSGLYIIELSSEFEEAMVRLILR